jgi:protein ImuB
VISRRESNALRIAALDEQAEALGLRRGMGLADARAMHPSIDVVEADPQADRSLLENLADWCDRYTPLVALDGDDGLFLDITGCAHLFGGERRLIDDVLARFSHQGFDARIGIASTVGAAWAGARFAGDIMIGPGEEAAFLAPLPLSGLRVAADVRGRLESVGLRTVGAVLATPRAPLARRFGAPLLLRLDQALGLLDEAVSPRLPVAPLCVDRHLAEPVTLIEDIERLVAALAAALRIDLERRGEGARTLVLSLFRVDGAVSRIYVGTSRPMREPLMIRKLFHERLAALAQDLDAGYGFDLARLGVLSSERLDAEQVDLADQGGRNVLDLDLALFADRIRARLGHDGLLKPVPVETHSPERAVLLLPFDGAAQPDSTKPQSCLPGRERPIRLFSPPEPVEVPATEVPEGPPLNFRWRHALYRVARAEGPERIAPEWWREGVPEREAREDDGQEDARNRDFMIRTARTTRDYFRVEDDEGRRFWLYRKGLYGGSREAPRWFMQGIFA